MEITAKETAKLTAESLPIIRKEIFELSLKFILNGIEASAKGGNYDYECHNSHLFQIGIIPHLEKLGYYIDIDSKSSGPFTKIYWGEGIPKKKKWYDFITKKFKK